jgi:hypothetical protein
VSWQACNKVDASIVNVYGDIERVEAVEIIARKQPHEEVITNEEGKTFLTKNIYYVDPKVEPNAYNINKYDTLDDEMIISTYRMCDLYNRVKMIRFITV